MMIKLGGHVCLDKIQGNLHEGQGEGSGDQHE